MRRLIDLKDCVGKKIKSIQKATFSRYSTFDKLRIIFEDGTFIEFESFDYDGYVSGINIIK